MSEKQRMQVRKLHSSPVLEFFIPDVDNPLKLPFYSGGVKAGFPSPAQDFMGEKIDLNTILIKHPSETFFAKVKGDSMKDAGISDGDIMVIDRSLPAEDGRIYVCYMDGEFTVKRVKIDKKTKTVWLMPENTDYKPVQVTEENESFLLWGRVISVIKNL